VIWSVTPKITRSSAIAEGLHNALCQLKSSHYAILAFQLVKVNTDSQVTQTTKRLQCLSHCQRAGQQVQVRCSRMANDWFSDVTTGWAISLTLIWRCSSRSRTTGCWVLVRWMLVLKGESTPDRYVNRRSRLVQRRRDAAGSSSSSVVVVESLSPPLSLASGTFLLAEHINSLNNNLSYSIVIVIAIVCWLFDIYPVIKSFYTTVCFIA